MLRLPQMMMMGAAAVAAVAAVAPAMWRVYIITHAKMCVYVCLNWWMVSVLECMCVVCV